MYGTVSGSRPKTKLCKNLNYGMKKLRDGAEAKVDSFSEWLTTYQNKFSLNVYY
jgi:hypothetical protein